MQPELAARCLLAARARVKEHPVHRVADAGVSAFHKAFLSSLWSAGVVDEQTALAAVEINAARLREALAAVLSRVFNASGAAHATQLKLKRTALRAAAAPQLIMKFNATNPRAVAWAVLRAATLVQGITADGRASIANLVAKSLQGEFGLHDLAKMLRITIGLTSRQGEQLFNLRERLLDEGESPGDVDDELAARAHTMLETRADTIAHHETMTAANAGQEELWQQAVEDGYLDADQQREWIVTEDDRACPICSEMDGKTTALGEPWQTGEGECDTPQDIHVGCRCTEGLAAGA